MASSMQPTADDDIQDSVLSLLECPVCMELMEPPITQCMNGHTVCFTCRTVLKQCPTCQESFTNIPCRVLDSLADKLLYPCKNVKSGCKEKLQLCDKAAHESKCNCYLYYCLPGLDTDCVWTGCRDELLYHVSECHSLRLYKPGGDVLHTAVSINNVQLVNMYNELFWYHKRQDSDRAKYFRALQYLGPKENAANFTCTYEFTLNCGSVKYKRIAYSEDDDIDSIYESDDTFGPLVNYVRKQREHSNDSSNALPNLLFCYTKIKKV